MPAASQIRTDIQVMRGLAILLVLLHHTDLDLIAAGFLGVDIFFVLSGYLITGMVARQIDDGRFAYGAFYFRRAKRLLPAACLVFAATSAAAIHTLDYREWNDYLEQLLGAVTFTGNIVLWTQTDYFSGSAALKPLLHVWSLAIEEQYYLLMPLLLAVVSVRWRLTMLVALAATSLALHMHWANHAPGAAFYLLPARAWELLLGSLIALIERGGHAPVGWVHRGFLPSLIVLAAVPLFGTGLAVPIDNLAVCLATAIVILCRHPMSPQHPGLTGIVVRSLAWLGDISYSLYLIHWPALALARNVLIGDPEAIQHWQGLALLIIVCSVPIAWLSYRLVEQPFRNMKLQPTRYVLATILLVSIILVLVPKLIHDQVRSLDRIAFTAIRADRRDTVGLAERCDFYVRFEPIRECMTAPEPGILVWGDSFAMHLVPGIIGSDDTGLGVMQATKSSCAPILGLAQIAEGYPEPLAANCIAFNHSVLAFLEREASIKIVVLSSPYYPYFDAAHRKLLIDEEQRRVIVTPSFDRTLHAQSATIDRIRALGKRIVVIAPPPSTGIDYTHCLERKAFAKTLSAANRDCDMPYTDYLASKREVLDFLDALGRHADVSVISFDRALCDRERCKTSLDNVMLYRDEGHFSTAGSIAVAQRMQLIELIDRLAH